MKRKVVVPTKGLKRDRTNIFLFSSYVAPRLKINMCDPDIPVIQIPGPKEVF